MTMPTRADIINAERQRMADTVTEKPVKLGVTLRVAQYSGNSSYPTEYTLDYQGIQACGPTFDMALTSWIEKLIEHKAKIVSQQPECALLGTSTQMPNSEFERKTYLFLLKDGEKSIPFNLQVHADGTIVAEPRPPQELDYDDFVVEDDEYDDEDGYDDGVYGDDEEDEEYGALDEDDPRR